MSKTCIHSIYYFAYISIIFEISFSIIYMKQQEILDRLKRNFEYQLIVLLFSFPLIIKTINVKLILLFRFYFYSTNYVFVSLCMLIFQKYDRYFLDASKHFGWSLQKFKNQTFILKLKCENVNDMKLV